MHPFTEWAGFLAAFLTTSAFIPQVLHIWKTKDTRGISLRMYLLFVTGIACWLVYGILIESIPIIVSNVIVLTLGIMILWFKIKFG
jgi:MtN3 and saliva related transmembrane protein